MTRVFLDTNVLVYAFSDEDHRRPVAIEVLARGGVISVQCLNEFVSVVRRKGAMPWTRVRSSLDEIKALCELCPLTLEVHELALLLCERHQLAIYDSLIVAAALVSRCETLLTEDMHHGLVVDRALTIRNPFV